MIEKKNYNYSEHICVGVSLLITRVEWLDFHSYFIKHYFTLIRLFLFLLKKYIFTWYFAKRFCGIYFICRENNTPMLLKLNCATSTEFNMCAR